MIGLLKYSSIKGQKISKFLTAKSKYKIKINEKNTVLDYIQRKTSTWLMGSCEIYVYFAVLRLLILLL